MSDEPVTAADQGADRSAAPAPSLNGQPTGDQTSGEQAKLRSAAEDTSAPLENLRTALDRAQAELGRLERQFGPRVGSPSAALPTQAQAPWQLPATQARFFVLALITSALLLFVRLFELDTLQSEVYGDIQIVHQYVKSIFIGDWPIRFTLSAGPLYHYLIAPIVAVAGLNYFGLKLASVAVSCGVLLATYGLSSNLIDDYFALLAVAVAGVSSWLLIFSRLGDVEILVPLLTTRAL